MNKCCIDGCTRPGVASANHDGASVYCAEHGICARCHESVEFFTFDEDRGIFMCPCRHLDLRPILDHIPQESNIIKFGDYTPKKRSTASR